MNANHGSTSLFDVMASLARAGRLLLAVAFVAFAIAGTTQTAGANEFADEVVADLPTEVALDEAPLPSFEASLVINLHACPAGLDASQLDIYQVAATCNLPAEPMAFEVHTSDGSHGATIDWLYSLDQLDPGKWVVIQHNPAGYLAPFAFCKLSAGFFKAPVAHGELIIEVMPGETLYCDWIVTPRKPRLHDDIVVDVDDLTIDPDPNDDPAAAGPSSLFVNGTACPEGFDAYAADIYGLAAGCGSDGPVTGFAFSMPTGYLELTANDPTVDPIQAGQITVTYHIPTGYGLPRVFCNDDQLLDLPTYEAAVSGSGGTASWTLEIAPGAWAYCDLFSIPAAPSTPVDDDGTAGIAGLTITQYACDVTTLQGPLSHENLAAACDLARARFAVVDGAGDQTRVNSGPDGIAAIAELSAGDVTVTQRRAPRTFDGPQLVFCRGVIHGDGYIADGAPFQPEVVDSTIALDLASGERMGCTWFNLNGAYVPFDGPASFQVDAATSATTAAAPADATTGEPVRIVRRSRADA